MFYIYLDLTKKNGIFASTSNMYFKSGSQSRLTNIVYKLECLEHAQLINSANIEHLLHVSHYIRKQRYNSEKTAQVTYGLVENTSTFRELMI